MEPIEQAILYIEDSRKPGTGKTLVKTSGVRAMDEDELLGWAFDFEGEFSEKNEEAGSLSRRESGLNDPYFYFHPLPSGCFAFCRMSTLPDDGNGTFGLTSHCLIVPPRLLRAFHNNILTLYHSLIARSDFSFSVPERYDDIASASLSPISMGVRHAPIVEPELLEALRDYPGATIFSHLVGSSINSVCTVFTWLAPSIQLINGIIQCLPIALRPELSFATSLHFSSLRPLRLIAAHENSRAARNICRQYAIPFLHIFHLDENLLRENMAGQREWGTLTYHLLKQERYDFLQRCMQGRLRFFTFETPCGTPDWYALNRLGKALLDRCETDGSSHATGETSSENEFVFPENFPDELLDELFPPDERGEQSPPEVVAPDEIDENVGPILRGDFPHAPFLQKSEPADDLPENSLTDSTVNDDVFAEIQKRIAQPLLTDSSADKPKPTSQKRLIQQFPRYERELRQMDSLVARSLFGDQMALEALEKAWGQLLKRLTFDQAGVVRETYIHLVQSIIVQPRDPEYPKPARRTIDSLDVLNIFLREY